MGHPQLRVTRKPRVAILATGDELVQPGEVCGPDQIVASNHFAVAAMVEALGGIAIDLGIAKDTHEALEAAFQSAEDQQADILVTLGGASVGDRDLVQSSLAQRGMQLGFWRIAMRPGKPLIFGSLGSMRILGLPGNPVSSIICAQIFLAPLFVALNRRRPLHRSFNHRKLLGTSAPQAIASSRLDEQFQDPLADVFGVTPFGKGEEIFERTIFGPFGHNRCDSRLSYPFDRTQTER